MINSIHKLYLYGNEMNLYKSKIKNKTLEESIKKNDGKFSDDMKQSELMGTVEDEKNEYNNEEESDTSSKIIVRPDGSRVLLVTMNFAGSSTTMSIKISEPTDMANEANPIENTMEEKSDVEPLTAESLQLLMQDKI